MFSDMRPTKILTAITAARLAGVDHIIEEGRFGGLSAFMYALHGFHVTSVEFLPLDGPTVALQQMSPDVRLVDGDGRVLVPALVRNMTDQQARRTMVIFDGEKRLDAYPTFEKIRDRVGVVIFDDTNLKNKNLFTKTLERDNHIFVNTWDAPLRKFIAKEKPALALLGPLNMGTQARWWGGVNNLQFYHFTIVKGGGWM